MTNHDAEHPDTKHPYDVEPGDEVHPGDPIVVDRYTGGARINHWINATLLVLLAISGLALFHPSLFFLSALFGGGQNTRAIHPWIGVIFVFTFLGLFLRFWRANLWKPEDGSWMRRLYDVLTNQEEKIPEVGKYNAGQKVVFWMMALLIIVLIGSGLLMWDQYFSQFTTPEGQADRGVRPFSRGDHDHQRLDCACLCGDLGARLDPSHGPGLRDRRLGLEASPQMAERAGDRQIGGTTEPDTRPRNDRNLRNCIVHGMYEWRNVTRPGPIRSQSAMSPPRCLPGCPMRRRISVRGRSGSGGSHDRMS